MNSLIYKAEGSAFEAASQDLNRSSLRELKHQHRASLGAATAPHLNLLEQEQFQGGEDWLMLVEPIAPVEAAELPNFDLSDPETTYSEVPSSSDDSKTVKASEPKPSSSKWSPKEHRRFLQALKLYGKDWPAVEKHVRTRSARQVRSHSQKFLQQLDRIINGDTPIERLSLQEAQYYYSILSQKQHRCTINRLKKAQKALEKPLFKIEKVARKSGKQAPEEEFEADDDTKSLLSKWCLDKEDEAFMGSLVQELPSDFSVELSSSDSIRQAPDLLEATEDCLSSFGKQWALLEAENKGCPADKAEFVFGQDYDQYASNLMRFPQKL